MKWIAATGSSFRLYRDEMGSKGARAIVFLERLKETGQAEVTRSDNDVEPFICLFVLR